MRCRAVLINENNLKHEKVCIIEKDMYSLCELQIHKMNEKIKTKNKYWKIIEINI